MLKKYGPVIIGLILVLGVVSFYISTKQGQATPAADTPPQTAQTILEPSALLPGETITDGDTFTFNKKEYTQVFLYPTPDGADFTSESYEWTTNGEPITNWNTLITTHKLSQRVDGPELSVDTYANNVTRMHEEAGAFLLETSIIGGADAEEAGIDISNPPYLLAYIFPARGQAAELVLQKIVQGEDDTITAFVYAQHKLLPDDASLRAYVEGAEFQQLRLDVINAEFPY